LELGVGEVCYVFCVVMMSELRLSLVFLGYYVDGGDCDGDCGVVVGE